MRIYWWNNGLHITGDKQDLELLAVIHKHLETIGSIDIGWPPDHPFGQPNRPIPKTVTSLVRNDEQSIES